MTNVVKFPSKSRTSISQIDIGQAFIYDDLLWIGIESSNKYNAIELVSGKGRWFKSSDYVQKVDLEIIIK